VWESEWASKLAWGLAPGCVLALESAKVGPWQRESAPRSESAWVGTAVGVALGIRVGVGVNTGILRLDNTVVRQSTQGIWVRSSQTNMFRNEIYSNETGLLVVGMISVNLRDSTIRNNNVGIQVVGPSNQVFLKGNNIFDNLEFNILVLGISQRSVVASGSWWGTTDKVLIAKKIYDQQDDPFLTAVVFEPIALKRIAAAP